MEKDSIIRLFPQNVRPYFSSVAEHMESLNEIRIRSDRPVLIVRGEKEFYITQKGEERNVEEKDIEPVLSFSQVQTERFFQHLCQDSPYAFEEELRKGFLTISGGHRIGVAGQILSNQGQVISIRNIRFLNLRITHEIIGCANVFAKYLYLENQQRWCSAMLIGPPGCGKTTYMRDLIRQISDGVDGRKAMTVGLVDERSEIAGCLYGKPQNDVGMRTDVLDGCPKICGMEMLLRSMAPKMIAIDEIGGEEDVYALRKVAYAGVGLLVTIHGDNLQQIRQKTYLKPLFEEQIFERFVEIDVRHLVTIRNAKGEIL